MTVLLSQVLNMIRACLFHQGPYGIFIWQYVAFILFFFASVFLGRLLTFLSTRLVFGFLKTKTQDKSYWNHLGHQATYPFTFLASSFLLVFFIQFLDLKPRTEQIFLTATHVLVLIGLFWFLWRLIDIFTVYLKDSSWVKESPAHPGLILLLTRLLKLFVALTSVASIMQRLGYPVTGLVAGLGIGGLAVALAAQKTLENLLGSLMLSIDKPFLVGDFVRVEGFEGVVESIGLRSSRIRTQERSLISVPNGKLADMRIESLAPRDRLLIKLSIEIDMSLSKLDKVMPLIQSMRTYLESHSLLCPGLSQVFVVDLASANLRLDVTCFVNGKDIKVLYQAREQILLQFLWLVQTHGCHLAVGPSCGVKKTN